MLAPNLGLELVAIHPNSGGTCRHQQHGRNLSFLPDRAPPFKSNEPHANPPRQRHRHGLSRSRRGSAFGLRAWHAGRFPHLVGGIWTAVETTPGDLGVLEAFFSGTLGRRRRRLSDDAACRGRDRLHRAAGRQATGPDGAFARRAYRVSRRAVAARFAAQDRTGRTRRRTGFFAGSRSGSRPLATRRAIRRISRKKSSRAISTAG